MLHECVTFILTATTGELGYNVMKKTDSFLSLWTSAVITLEYKVTVNSEELIGIA
jgi:hypothetical protein